MGKVAGKKRRKAIDCSVFKNFEFFLLFLCFSFYSIGYFIPFVHLVPYAIKFAGETRESSAALFIALGAGTTVGRIFSGFVADRIGILQVYLLAIICTGIPALFIPLMTKPGMLYFFVIPFGMFAGARIALVSLLVAELLGLENLPTKMGMMFLCIAPASIFGPVIGGAIFDSTNSYTAAFLFGGGMMLGSIPFLVTILYRRAQKKKYALNVVVDAKKDDRQLDKV